MLVVCSNEIHYRAVLHQSGARKAISGTFLHQRCTTTLMQNVLIPLLPPSALFEVTGQYRKR